MATSPPTPPTNNLATLAAGLARRAPPGPLWLAFSGGLDSTVLLHLLVEAGLGERLGVLHVDHGLQADSAAWAAHCVRHAAGLGLTCRVANVTVSGNGGLEANARTARYQALCRHAGGATLITAHHLNDQAETLLLRLLRGAGVGGLAAIGEHGRWHGTPLWRPLLTVPRATLHGLAEQYGWDWIEDPSNRHNDLRRNHLRNDILPRLQQQWPGAVATLARAAGHQAEAAALLAERATEDLAALGGAARHLPLAPLKALSPARRGNVLRHWLAGAGAVASEAQLNQIEALLGAAADRAARVEWGDWQLRRFAGALHLLSGAQCVALTGEWHWHPSQGGLDLGPWRLCDGVTPENDRVPVWLAADSAPLRLAPACGGERLLRQGCHQRVSELWRAAGVPPWRRRQWPLIYQDGELVSVPGVGVADGWRQRSLRLWHLCWRGAASSQGADV
mgnify:CR=1 FL=1